MISIVLAIILGVGFTIVATQNPDSVTLTVFDSRFMMPLYLFGAFSFLLGVLVSAIFHIFDFIGTMSDVSAKDAQLKDLAKANEQLQYQLQKTGEENNHLREELGQTRGVLREERVESTKDRVRNFFGRVRQNFT